MITLSDIMKRLCSKQELSKCNYLVPLLYLGLTLSRSTFSIQLNSYFEYKAFLPQFFMQRIMKASALLGLNLSPQGNKENNGILRDGQLWITA